MVFGICLMARDFRHEARQQWHAKSINRGRYYYCYCEKCLRIVIPTESVSRWSWLPLIKYLWALTHTHTANSDKYSKKKKKSSTGRSGVSKEKKDPLLTRWFDPGFRLTQIYKYIYIYSQNIGYWFNRYSPKCLKHHLFIIKLFPIPYTLKFI